MEHVEPHLPLLGIVTIGQSPRPDLAHAFAVHAPGATVEVRGALDGLSVGEVERLARIETSYPLLVRCADGSGCAIGLDVLHPLVERAAQEFARDGAQVVAIACAGAFPDIECAVPVVLPGKVVPAVVGAIATTRRVGVVTPIQSQVGAAAQKWRDDGFEPTVTWASPLEHHELANAAAVMRAAAVDLVILDCMGHDESYATEFADRCGRRVITAQSLTARVTGEFLRAPQ